MTENIFKKIFKPHILISLRNLLILISLSILFTFRLAKLATPPPIDVSDDLNSKCKDATECLQDLKQRAIKGVEGETMGTSTIEKLPESSERLRTFLGIPLSVMLFNISLQNNGSFLSVESKKPIFKGPPHYADLWCDFNQSQIIIPKDSIIPTKEKVGYDTTGQERARLVKIYNGCLVVVQQKEISSLEFPVDSSDASLTWERKVFIILTPDFLSYCLLFIFVFPLVITVIEISKKTFFIYKNGLSYFKES